MIRLYRCLSSLQAHLRLTLPLLAWCAAMPAAHAADALNGKNLYLNGPAGGGTSCTACHGATPAANVNGILAAANKPAVISSAFAANRGGMGSLYNGRFSDAEIADLAAFIGNPAVTAAPAASVSPAALGFGATLVGQAATPLSTTLSNSGNATLNVSSLSISGAAAADYTIGAGGCAPGAALAPGASCAVQVGFTPGAAGTRNASLVIAHNGAGGTSSVTLSGTGNAAPQAVIALSANAIDFGPLVAGVASATRTVTVNNSGQAALTFTSIGVTGANANVFSVGGSCAVPTPLAPGASCTVTVGANASASGAFSGSLALASNASNGTVNVALSGSVAAAAPALLASPAMIAFGAQTIGGVADTQDVILSNGGNVALALNGIAITGGGGSVTIAGKTCGATLAPGAACSVTVAFAPAAPGALAAQLTVTSNAAPLQVAVGGSGTTDQVARATLSEAGPVAFADTRVGQRSAVHTLTLSNAGAVPLKLASLVLNGAQTADFVLEGSCAAGATVAPSSSCTIDAGFRPSAAGVRAASLVLMTDAGRQFTVALGGTGIAVPVPQLTFDPQSFDFGSASLGASTPAHRIAMTNGGADAVLVTSVSFTGPFALQTGAGAGACAAVPFTLQPGARCDLAVGFTPLAAGAAAGAMAVAAEGGVFNVALTGSASAASVAAGPTAAAPQNAGGGGCSASTSGNDPVLALLVVLSIGVLAWRRFNPKKELQS